MSRRAYDILESEVSRLREHNERLFDHAIRMARVEHGRPELPAEKKKIDPMPNELTDILDSWSEPTRTLLYDEARRAYRGSWDPVVRHMRASLDEDPPEEVDEP